MVEVKCKKCGQVLKFYEEVSEVTCKFCAAKIQIEAPKPEPKKEEKAPKEKAEEKPKKEYKTFKKKKKK